MTQISRMAGSMLTASAFNQLGQYASSPGRRGYCYAEFAVAVIIASTHCAYARRDGQAELAWVAGYQIGPWLL